VTAPIPKKKILEIIIFAIREAQLNLVKAGFDSAADTLDELIQKKKEQYNERSNP